MGKRNTWMTVFIGGVASTIALSSCSTPTGEISASDAYAQSFSENVKQTDAICGGPIDVCSDSKQNEFLEHSRETDPTKRAPDKGNGGG